MDVLLVDVGFGTCNVILIGSGEAIVIDAGERSKEVLAVLHHFSVRPGPARIDGGGAWAGASGHALIYRGYRGARR
jgi:hypothetical protein